MKLPNRSAIGLGLRVARGAALLVPALVFLMPAVLRAQPPLEPKRVLVLYWDNKDFPGNVMFDQTFQAALKERPGASVEYYPEYLEPTRFPGESQALVLRDYLRGKYAGRNIDVVVALGDPPLAFLLKHRTDLFTRTPIVFNAVKRPSADDLAAPPGLTGIISVSTHRKTLDLALQLHPDTERVFIISGTLEQDKRFEIQAREELQGYEARVRIDYLTDLPLNELIEIAKGLPKRSIVLYAWQQALNEEGKVLESRDTLARISPLASVPFYGMGTGGIGYGLVGGFISGPDSNGTRLAEVVLRILNGERPQDIPVEAAPSGPKFDWRQLRRWAIREQDLPPGSAILFREYSFLELYRWQVTGVVALVILEALLIAVLLANRARRMKAERESARQTRLAELEYRRREEIVSNVPGIVWEARAEPGSDTRKVEFLSNYAEKMLGYRLEEWSSNPQFGASILLEVDRERVAHTTEEVLRSGKESTVQYRWLAKDGRVLWAEAHLSPILDETGQTLGLRGVTLDISERKHAENSLRENRMQLAGIIDSAMDAIISLDEDQRIVLLNPAAEQMFGYSADDLTGTPIDQLIPERLGQARSVRDYGASTVSGRPLGAPGALYGRRSNGEEFPIEASVSQVTLDGRKFYTAILRDIADRIRAQEALQESEERFRTMADTAPVMIWVAGPDKRCTYFNQRWLDFTGRTIEEEIGSGWADGVHPDDLASCLQTYNTSFDSRKPFTMEYRLRRADGEFRWVYDSGTPRLSSSQEFLGYIGSCLDITERKETEQALIGLSGQLIRAQEDERARIARELHDDLNQRMALVSVWLERLRQNPPETNAELRKHLQEIMDQTLQISKEIHRMSYDLHPSWLRHVGLVPAVKALCEELRPRHGLIVEFTDQDVPASLPQDVSLCLYRIVQECMSNIIKHSGVTEAQVILRGSENEIRLRISDPGRGFDIESTRTRKGLGLISMRERLRLVGGEVSINSRPSQGAQIDARVPLQRADTIVEDPSGAEQRQTVS